MRRFEDKVILITGAASGIGKACALRMGEEGGKVVCTDVVKDQVEDTAAAISNEGGEAVALLCNVSCADDVDQTVKEVIDRYGKLD